MLDRPGCGGSPARPYNGDSLQAEGDDMSRRLRERHEGLLRDEVCAPARQARGLLPRRPLLPQPLLRRHVEPGLPERLPDAQRPRPTCCASGPSCPTTWTARTWSGRGAPDQPGERRPTCAASTSWPSRSPSRTTTSTSCGCCAWPGYRCGRPTGGRAIPLVVMGGSALFLNPEPLAPFADLVAVGEGEALVPRMMDALQGAPTRAPRLDALTEKDGFYVRRATRSATTPTARWPPTTARAGSSASAAGRTRWRCRSR